MEISGQYFYKTNTFSFSGIKSINWLNDKRVNLDLNWLDENDNEHQMLFIGKDLPDRKVMRIVNGKIKEII